MKRPSRPSSNSWGGLRPWPSSVAASHSAGAVQPLGRQLPGAGSLAPRVHALATVLCASALGINALGCAVSPQSAQHPSSEHDPDIVAHSATPFVARVSGRDLSEAETRQLLLSRRVVCVGETHTDPGHHWVQWQVIETVGKRAQAAGERFAVGFEMFDRTQQSSLDAKRAGKLDDSAFVAESGYAERWGFDYDLYRPLLDAATARGAALLGLNAPKDWTRRVARQGLSGISEQLRSQLPELELDVPEHRAFFTAAMQHHPGHASSEPKHDAATTAKHRESAAGATNPSDATPKASHAPGEGETAEAHVNPAPPDPTTEQDTATPPEAPSSDAQPAHPAHAHGHPSHQSHQSQGAASPDNDPLAAMYAAQVVWDETMAESAAEWFAAAPQTSRLVIIAGMGHCHRSAVPRRFERRTDNDVLSVRAIRRAELSEPQLPHNDQFDALLVMGD